MASSSSSLPADSRVSYAKILGGEPTPKVNPNENSGSLSRHGDVICIKIDEDAYQRRVSFCQNSLISRLSLIKGDKPWKYEDLRKKLQETWQIHGNWKNDFSRAWIL